MPEIGQTISHYRILEKLGQGGMGEVFLAHDTSLDRKVALKFLPDIFSGDPERLARFEREAKLLASLNHPNIAMIFGLEQAAGKRFLAMELVEGETLAQQIERGPLPVDETLEVCRQIAEGLEAAHEKGVIHRDLKPANVKITPEGKVKILDFGLAKAFQGDSLAADASKSPTLTDQMTRPGVILGTAAYMAPEQAKGKAVDKRADIWAFGCILYECLTGKRPFHGETVTETLASILKGEPDWKALPEGISRNSTVVLRRCLQKDPKERLHDIADVRIEIKETMAQPVEAATVPRRFSLLWLGVGAAVLVFVSILVERLLNRYFHPTAAAAVVTSTVRVEPGLCLYGVAQADVPMELQRPSRTAIAISSDNKFIVYSAVEENSGAQAHPQLYLRNMDQPEAKRVEGTEGAVGPFLSYDNRWIGFWANEELWKVPVEGGKPTHLCKAPFFFGATWGIDDTIVFSAGGNPSTGDRAGLSIIPARGGKTEPFTTPDPKRGEFSHRLPSWLPNGKAVLFTLMSNFLDSRPRIAVVRKDTRQYRILLEDAADARYVSPGYLVFLRKDKLMARRFDPDRLIVDEEECLLVQNVMQAFTASSFHNTGAGQFAVSVTGWLVYSQGGLIPLENNSLVWVDQNGMEQPVTDRKFPFQAPRLSPDGQRIVYYSYGLEQQIWVYDIARDAPSQLTSDGWAIWPIWTPDGKRIVFSYVKSEDLNLFWQPYDRSLQMERFSAKSDYMQRPGSWNRDGSKLAIVESHGGDAGIDVSILDTGTKSITQFLNSDCTEKTPEFSHDGLWLAYTSAEANKHDQIYVTDFPNKSKKVQITSEGGEQPLWAKDGKQLFYRRQDEVWAVDIQSTGDFKAGKPHRLFRKPESWRGAGGVIRDYDLDLNSTRFLMVKVEQRKPTPVTEMILIQNWSEELNRRLPIK